MSQFMRHNHTHPLPLSTASFHFINQQFYLPIRHQSPILHGPRRKFRNGDHIQFGQRIRRTKKVVVQIQSLQSAIERKTPVLALSRGSVHPDRHAMIGNTLDKIELPHTKSDQVTRHAGTVRICNFFQFPSRETPATNFRHVTERREVGGHDEGHAKYRFPGGFVPARERAPGIQAFELGARHNFALAVNVSVRRAVEARHLVVQLSREGDGDGEGGVGGEWGGEDECDCRGFEVDNDGFGFDC
mmetsp:Transcript_53237/g.64196  ORF Transcript_53237/g.64196 Transcript_53237/m.64196 type:complete len:244 (-) Transcript_53237:285-1016(-)